MFRRATKTFILASLTVLTFSAIPNIPAPASAAEPKVTQAAFKAVMVDDYGLYQGQNSCDPHAKPGVVGTKNLLTKKFGGGDLGIVRACNSGGVSEHKEGRAFDWALNAGKQKDRRIAAKGIKWLTGTVDGEKAYNARRLGVMYIIWNKKMWRAYDVDSGWQPYTGYDNHTSHVHISFTWNGATKRTSYWKGQPQPLDYGPCVKREGKLAAPWTKPRLTPCPTPLPRKKN